MKLNQKLQKINMLLLDVDGVMTSGTILLGDEQLEIKAFNIHDGLGIKMAQMGGIKIGIITSRSSAALAKRAKELKIEDIFQGQQHKLEAYQQILAKYNLQDTEIAYIGDDLPDLPLVKRAGVGIAVANAREEIKNYADYITKNRGGEGAIREVTDLILKVQQKWDYVLTRLKFYD